MVVIDSDALINLLRKTPDARKIAELIKNMPGASTTRINEFELLVGMKLSNKPVENAKKVEELLSGLKILDLSKEAIQKASDIRANLIKTGQIIGINDVFIAAIAITNNEPLLTKNIAHFQRIPGLKIQQI